MKPIFAFLVVLAGSLSSNAQTSTSMSTKQVMLKQLKTTHNQEEWFAPLQVAIDGLTPEQANWKGKGSDHSIAELTAHLIFWNSTELAKFLKQPAPAYSGNNDETFSTVNENEWPAMVKKSDTVLTAWENAIEAADETKLATWYETIANINTHNAYHTGQIVYIRKVQGSWSPEKGVK